ncbi:MAG TPA: type II toxin-antitoxin system prevent-host-death family antitoxin [Caulobacteraceae bacterium]|nr:type II toxin-antitoxin system prevent-host-death family antitoxin [Caulobacteraceae bacterium]
MGTYSVAEAKNTLPSLIDKAAAGEEVIITRHGKPVAELRAAAVGLKMPNREAFEKLRERREARESVGITSVELLNLIYEEPED